MTIDTEVRECLRDFRIKTGRESNAIFMSKTHFYLLMKEWQSMWSGFGSPCNRETAYGVNIVIWEHNKIECQPYILNGIEWES